jgi:hypothetical protein
MASWNDLLTEAVENSVVGYSVTVESPAGTFEGQIVSCDLIDTEFSHSDVGELFLVEAHLLGSCSIQHIDSDGSTRDESKDIEVKAEIFFEPISLSQTENRITSSFRIQLNEVDIAE